jgi:branched-chain amino acid aminotransferase
MCIINGELHTPALSDTILDGVTRRSILEIAKHENIKVIEEKLSVNYMLKAIEDGTCNEAFVCGTASVVVPISSFLDKDKRVYSLKDPQGKVSMQLREKLIGIQAGRTDGPEGWMHSIKEINF